MIDSAKPMVGRDRERDLVLDHLDQATEGASHFVFVSGEPGIGGELVCCPRSSIVVRIVAASCCRVPGRSSSVSCRSAC